MPWRALVCHLAAASRVRGKNKIPESDFSKGKLTCTHLISSLAHPRWVERASLQNTAKVMPVFDTKAVHLLRGLWNTGRDYRFPSSCRPQCPTLRRSWTINGVEFFRKFLFNCCSPTLFCRAVPSSRLQHPDDLCLFFVHSCAHIVLLATVVYFNTNKVKSVRSGYYKVKIIRGRILKIRHDIEANCGIIMIVPCNAYVSCSWRPAKQELEHIRCLCLYVVGRHSGRSTFKKPVYNYLHRKISLLPSYYVRCKNRHYVNVKAEAM